MPGLPLHPKKRAVLLRLATALALAGCAQALAAAGLLSPLRRASSDALVRAAARHGPEPAAGIPDAALVAIDPQSLRHFPSWPWPRELYGRALNRLDAAGAAAVVFDLDFSSPSELEQDARLAAAISASGRVVLSALREFQEVPGVGKLEVSNRPLPALAASSRVGHVVLPIDTDGLVRHTRGALELSGRATPSLAGAALGLVLREPEHARVEAPLPIDYRRAGAVMPLLSIADVIEGRFDPREVAGRVVFIGATAAAFQDLWNTPLGPAQPGVWIQALAYRTLAARAAGLPTLRTLPALGEATLLVLLSLGLLPLGRRSHLHRSLALAAAGAGLVGIACFGVVEFGIVVPLASSGLLLLFHYVANLEALRRGFRWRLDVQEQELSAIAEIGELSTQSVETGPGLRQGLVLLQDATGAAGVALFRADAIRGDLEPKPLGAGRPAGNASAAARSLGVGRPRWETEASGGGALYLPLCAGNRRLGVLVLARDEGFDNHALRTAETVAAQLVLALDNQRLVVDLRNTFNASAEAVATAIEARDGYTEMHCRRPGALFRDRG